MIRIRPLANDDCEAVVEIVQNLPEWFDKHARRIAVPIDARHQNGFLALDEGQTVGFVTYFVYEGRLHIGWLGVKKSHQRQGIGTALLHQLEIKAREMAIPEIALYTLGDGVDYPPYEQTRRFYFKNGFRIYQRSTTDNPSCPVEIRLSKTLQR